MGHVAASSYSLPYEDAGFAPSSDSLPPPPQPQGVQDRITLNALKKIATLPPEQQFDGLTQVTNDAKLELTPQARALYDRALVASVKEPLNIDTLNRSMAQLSGGNPPTGPFTLWLLDAMLMLQRNVRAQQDQSELLQGRRDATGQAAKPNAISAIAAGGAAPVPANLAS